MKPYNRKAIIGMSGGVDSSVAAAILKKQGYDVTGVFLRLWKENYPKKGEKISEDEMSARKVTEKLGINFRAVEAREKFKKEVVGYFLREYKNGRTPNPCVFCNENFKFKLLFEAADKIGAEYVATGHYALVRKFKVQPASPAGGSSKFKIREKSTYKLLAAKDKNKDQSYFLYRLKQKQLGRIIFPLGEHEKEEVKEMAKKMELSVAQRPESQDICFLKGTCTNDFLKKNIKNVAGKIEDTSGRAVGSHAGLSLYTLGQRKGINIGGTGPYYVLSKNYKRNVLIVTNNKKDLSLFSSEAILEKVAWINEKPKFPVRFQTRTRYRNLLVYATISLRGKKYGIKFKKPQRAVTPGQSVVFYGKNEEVIGGAIIK